MTTKATKHVIKTDAVEATQLANDAVDTAAILNAAVTDVKLGALSVTAPKIASNAVETAKINDLAVTTAKLADSSVTNAKMAVNAINTAQLIDLSVTEPKLANGAVSQVKLSFTALAAGGNTLWMPARAIYPSASNGASATVMSFASNTKPSIPVITFSTSVKQYAEFAIRMPKSYNNGNITLHAIWAHPSTTTNFGVRWEAAKLHVGDGENLDTALGSTVAVSDTGGSTNYLYISPGITLTGGSPAIADLSFFQIARDVAHTDDNLAVTAYLLGVVLIYTSDKGNDD